MNTAIYDLLDVRKNKNFKRDKNFKKGEGYIYNDSIVREPSEDSRFLRRISPFGEYTIHGDTSVFDISDDETHAEKLTFLGNPVKFCIMAETLYNEKDADEDWVSQAEDTIRGDMSAVTHEAYLAMRKSILTASIETLEDGTTESEMKRIGKMLREELPFCRTFMQCYCRDVNHASIFSFKQAVEEDATRYTPKFSVMLKPKKNSKSPLPFTLGSLKFWQGNKEQILAELNEDKMLAFDEKVSQGLAKSIADLEKLTEEVKQCTEELKNTRIW